MFTIAIPNSLGQAYGCHLDRNPDKCPICHRGISPTSKSWDLVIDNGLAVERVFICPLRSCQHLFVARYYRNTGASSYSLDHCVPTELEDCSLPPEIKKISPDFCSIYNEAHKAEQLGLLLVCGPGYRKALEFLIKDYLTSLQITEDTKKKIAESALMVCIKNYVTDTRMQTTAERATWLGNDETHYIRKWENKDLEDLKKFIQLTCFWIQSEHLTAAAVVDMPKGKK